MLARGAPIRTSDLSASAESELGLRSLARASAAPFAASVRQTPDELAARKILLQDANRTRVDLASGTRWASAPRLPLGPLKNSENGFGFAVVSSSFWDCHLNT